jgi:hypothetical protein
VAQELGTDEFLVTSNKATQYKRAFQK